MIKIYGKPNCPKCNGLKLDLDLKSIEYEYTDDFKETAKIGSKHMIMSAPIIEYNGKVYSNDDFKSILEKL